MTQGFARMTHRTELLSIKCLIWDTLQHHLNMFIFLRKRALDGEAAQPLSPQQEAPTGLCQPPFSHVAQLPVCTSLPVAIEAARCTRVKTPVRDTDLWGWSSPPRTEGTPYCYTRRLALTANDSVKQPPDLPARKSYKTNGFFSH